MQTAFTTPCRNAEKGHPNILFWNVRCWGVNNFLIRLSSCVNTWRLRFRQNSRRNGVHCIGLGATQARFRWRAACVTGTMCSEGGQHANLVVGQPRVVNAFGSCFSEIHSSVAQRGVATALRVEPHRPQKGGHLDKLINNILAKLLVSARVLNGIRPTQHIFL